MTTEERVLQIFERANPVRDDAHVEPQLQAADYLDGLRRREMDVMLTRSHLDDRTQRFVAGEPPRRSRVVAILLAAAVAAIVVGGLITIGTRGGTEEVPAVPAPTTTGAPTTTDVSTTIAPTTTVGVPSEDAAAVPSFGASAVPGRYWSFVLGVDVEFTLPRTLYVASNELGSLGLIDGYDAVGGTYSPDTGRALAFRRLGGWSTRDEAVSRTPTGSIDPYDIDAWVAANDVNLLADTTTEIDGHPTRVVDVQVDPASAVQAPEGPNGCFAGWEPCFHYGLTVPRPTARKDWVSAQRITRFYLVTIDGSEPVLIEVGAPPGSDFFDEVASTVIPSIVFGPDAPPLP